MKRLPAPDVLLRQWLQSPHAITVAAFALAGILLGIAGWLIHRNLRHNEPGLRAPLTLPFALIISAAGVFGAWRLPYPWGLVAGSVICGLAALLFHYADHRRWVRDPAGKTVADRWQIVLTFAGFRWTRDKANRHFFFSGDTGSGKTSGMNGLLAALISRNPTLGGVVMAFTMRRLLIPSFPSAMTLACIRRLQSQTTFALPSIRTRRRRRFDASTSTARAIRWPAA